MRYTISGLILALVIAYFWGGKIQRSLLYYPGEVRVPDVRQYASENGLMLWPEEGIGYKGIISRGGPSLFRGTVVVFHGNAGTAVTRRYYIDALEKRGYRVVLAEYPGYGGRPGRTSERSFVADARGVALLAKEKFGGPVYLWGESLGCGVASALSCDAEISPAGVVLLTPWDSLLNEAKVIFPRLPVRLFLRDRYDNAANLSGCKGPVAVIMAGRDEIIPNALTERLYESLSLTKRIWIFRNAGHNDWPVQPDLQWWDEVMSFLESNRLPDS